MSNGREPSPIPVRAAQTSEAHLDATGSGKSRNTLEMANITYIPKRKHDLSVTQLVNLTGLFNEDREKSENQNVSLFVYGAPSYISSKSSLDFHISCT